jgi:dTDP-4-amino-4,6-dideoxygalactose transaminase
MSMRGIKQPPGRRCCYNLSSIDVHPILDFGEYDLTANNRQRINDTKTYLPPLEEYVAYLQGIWENNQVTNFGPLVVQLESDLKEYLQVENLFLVTNGTIALQIAIKALNLQGEIITTPFSYVATTSSIVWEGCRPVFADIDRETLCIDPARIEEKITPQTSAILATHVYGYPCDVERIQRIAEDHGMKVIYDAAHTFGVKYQGKSLLQWGDVSTLSFHATKLFHTGEGGAIVTKDAETAHKVKYMYNFGHHGQEDFWGLGINGKMSELQAAMGLCVLPAVPDLIEKRKTISDHYSELLKDSGLSRPVCLPGTEYNYAYYPVLFKSQESLLRVKTALNEENIFPRRYFFPSLDKLPYVSPTEMPVAADSAERVLCLPLSAELTLDDVGFICAEITSHLS